MAADSGHLITRLQSRLAKRATAKSRAFWSGYLKGALPFRGVPMGENRKAVAAWLREDGAGALPPSRLKALGVRLIRQSHAEDKLAGVLLFAEHLLERLTDADVDRFAALFDKGHIADWNTCDWFCVKVLGPWVAAPGGGTPIARRIAAWKAAETLWQRRAASVAFVNLVVEDPPPIPGLSRLVIGVMNRTVRHPERFAQTGVGWVLRELAVTDPDAVIAFVERHGARMSREALRSAVRKLPAAEKRRLLG